MTKVEKTPNADGTYDIEVTCEKCGGRITHSDEYGMWCDQECGREEALRVVPIFDEYLDELVNCENPMNMLSRIDHYAKRIDEAREG